MVKYFNAALTNQRYKSNCGRSGGQAIHVCIRYSRKKLFNGFFELRMTMKPCLIFSSAFEEIVQPLRILLDKHFVKKFQHLGWL